MRLSVLANTTMSLHAILCSKKNGDVGLLSAVPVKIFSRLGFFLYARVFMLLRCTVVRLYTCSCADSTRTIWENRVC